MSFSSDVKTELCKNSIPGSCCASAEAYGALLYAGWFGASKIRLATESAAYRKRIQVLFQKVFGFAAEFSAAGQDSVIHHMVLTEKDKLRKVFFTFGYEHKEAPIHINFGMLEKNCCRSAFLRGAFLSGGSILNPEKKYHLEITSHHQSLVRETMVILHEMEFTPKQSRRRSDYMIYLKDSTAIEDFLTLIGAPMSAMAIMQIKVEKELRNEINRRTNCDDANITKIVLAAEAQINAIQTLIAAGRLGDLPETLRQTAEIRLNHPDLPLRELLPFFDPQISKPGLNHRLKKLIALAEREGSPKKPDR